MILIHLSLLSAALITQPLTEPTALTGKPAIRACEIVTTADVERALLRNAPPGKQAGDSSESTCDYQAGNGQITVVVRKLRTPVDLRAEAEALQAAIPNSSIKPAPEFGSKAFYLDIAEAGTQIYIVRSEALVMVSVLGFDAGAQASGAAKRLAVAALARMEQLRD